MINVQFMQLVYVRDSAKEKLHAWPKLHTLRIMQIPIQDPYASAIIGAGKYFDSIYAPNDLMCYCISTFDIFQEGSCLKELVEYLSKGREYENPTYPFWD